MNIGWAPRQLVGTGRGQTRAQLELGGQRGKKALDLTVIFNETRTRWKVGEMCTSIGPGPTGTSRRLVDLRKWSVSHPASTATARDGDNVFFSLRQDPVTVLER